jgi:hypothetical protein
MLAGLTCGRSGWPTTGSIKKRRACVAQGQAISPIVGAFVGLAANVGSRDELRVCDRGDRTLAAEGNGESMRRTRRLLVSSRPLWKPSSPPRWPRAMFNLPAHKSAVAEKAINVKVAWLLFLPLHSPDLNSIEMVFSKIQVICAPGLSACRMCFGASSVTSAIWSNLRNAPTTSLPPARVNSRCSRVPEAALLPSRRSRSSKREGPRHRTQPQLGRNTNSDECHPDIMAVRRRTGKPWSRASRSRRGA